MAKRPKLSKDSLLRYVFHPKTAPKPLGIRKSLVKSTKWKSGRKSAWNKMDADKQQTIIAAGQQNSYLTGNTTLADARKALRPQAIAKGITKPTRADKRSNSNSAIVNHILSLTNNRPDKLYRSTPNPKAVAKHVASMDGESKAKAMGLSSYEELVNEASDPNNIDEDGINPFWYH